MPLPQAPTLNTPANGQILDVFTAQTFTWTYNNADPTQDQTNYAFRKWSYFLADYQYWNAAGSSWSAASIVWNASSTKSVSLPLAALEIEQGSFNMLSDTWGSFSTGLGQWFAFTNCTIARDTGTKYMGAGSMKITTSAAGTAVASSGQAWNINNFSTTAGEKFNARALVIAGASTAGRAAFIRYKFYQTGGTFISDVDGQSFTISNTGWTSVESYNVVAPALATRFIIQVVITGATAASEAYYVDAVVAPYAGYSLPSMAESFSWSVACQNSSGIGPWANDQVFTLAVSPTVTVSAPTGSPTMSRPLVQWTAPNVSGFGQDAYQIKVFDSATYGGGGFDPNTSTPTWDSGLVVDTATSARIGANLINGTAYRAYVRMRIGGTVGALFSAWAFSGFTESFSVPSTPGLTVTPNPTTGNFTLTCTNGSSVQYVLDRSYDGGVTWEEVRGATRTSPTSAGTSVAVTDDEAPLRIPVTYRCYAATGTAPNLAYSAAQQPAAQRCDATSWWVRDPLTPSSRVAITQATGESNILSAGGTGFSPEGRTKPVVLFSRAPIGSKVKLEAQALSEANHDAILALLTARKTLCLQNVHGDRWYVRLVSDITRTQVKAGALATENFPVRFYYAISCELMEVETP